MIIDFMRHGLPMGGSRYRGGGCDDPLSERGWQQMWQAVSGERPWSRVISSPMQRCRAFAEQFATEQALPLESYEALKEVGFGSWEGKTKQELRADLGAGFDAFYADPVTNRPPGAEDLDLFIGRVGGVIETLRRDFADDHLLVVAHAGVIRAAIAYVIGLLPGGMYRIQVGNGELTRFEFPEGKAGLLLFHGRQLL